MHPSKNDSHCSDTPKTSDSRPEKIAEEAITREWGEL